MDIVESFRTFGTIVFSRDIMNTHIGSDILIELSSWYITFVPYLYKTDLYPLILRTLSVFSSERCNDITRWRFIIELETLIQNELKPIHLDWGMKYENN